LHCRTCLAYLITLQKGSAAQARDQATRAADRAAANELLATYSARHCALRTKPAGGVKEMADCFLACVQKAWLMKRREVEAEEEEKSTSDTKRQRADGEASSDDMSEITSLINQREQARQARDWNTADRIRDELNQQSKGHRAVRRRQGVGGG
jgi:cysteinyl-tRNA synthetase